jgi:hypothetical protein
LAGVSLLIAIGSPIVGVLWWRKNGRDQRYAGLPPGMVPLAGQESQIVPNDPDIPIPVAFSPPKIPVAEAGLLIDGQVDARETAATIIDLAVRGALTVQSYREDEFQVTLVDPSKATAPHEMVLLTSLFNGRRQGGEDLLRGGSRGAHQRMRAPSAARSRLAAGSEGALGRSRWRLRLGIFAIRSSRPSRSGSGCCCCSFPCCRSSSLLAVIQGEAKAGSDRRRPCRVRPGRGFQDYLARCWS